MALATKCPQCGALFRVVADQLKLRGGLVRCGECRTVFDAIGSLTYVDDHAVAQARATTEVERGVPQESDDDESHARHALGPSTTLRISPVPPATIAGSLPPRTESFRLPVEEPAIVRRRAGPATTSSAEEHEADATTTGNTRDRVPTLVGTEESGGGGTEGPVEEIVIEPAEAPPSEQEETVDAGASEGPPSFARPPRTRPRGFSIVYGGGSALLVLFALVQAAVIFRSELMIRWPESRLLLNDACSLFRCTVNWPAQADQLAVIGSELQSIPGTDALELSAVIRNRAEFRQSLPALEVTLTDARNRALARKVFTPADYLASAGEPTARLQEGLAPGSDLTIRIFFEARGLAPAGFLVYPFYL